MGRDGYGGLEQETKPLSELEAQVLKQAGFAVSEAIKLKLCAYDGPLEKYAAEVVGKHAAEIKNQMDAALTTTINGDEFKAAIAEAFSHKLAKVVVSKMEGAIEKTANTLCNDPGTKARILLAVEGVIKDIGKKA